MIRKALLILLPALALAGCASTPAVVGSASTLNLAVPGQPGRPIALKAITGEVDFPNGETHNFTAIAQVNPKTGKPLPKGRGLKFLYVSNGETTGRVAFKVVGGAIVPAAVLGGSNIAAAGLLRGGSLILNNSNSSRSYSSSSSNSGSAVSVKVKN